MMEEHEDGAVRGLLGTAFDAAEPPLRDLASGSIARGDAARRRNRWYAAGGTALSLAAVIGTFAAVAGSGGAAARPTQSGATTPAPKVSEGQYAKGAFAEASYKAEDIRMKLPKLLQPMLPAGVTVKAAPTDYSPLNTNGFLLTGPTGTTWLTVSGGGLHWPSPDDKKLGCQQADCEVRKVPGGTVYVNSVSHTAAEDATDLKSSVKPGTAGTVTSRDLSMMFVPDDRSRPYLQFRESTSVAAIQYADLAPAGWAWNWPPSSSENDGLKNTYDPQGVQLSADDFAALVGHRGIEAVEELLDSDRAAAPEAVKALEDRNARLTELLAPVLPAGVKPRISTEAVLSNVVLDGPSALNTLRIWTAPRDKSLFSESQGCPRGVKDCDRRAVPGGQILVWGSGAPDAKDGAGFVSGGYEYWFLPDDASKPVVGLSLSTVSPKSAGSDMVMTKEQFIAAVANPHFADIVSQAKAMLDQ